MATKKTKKATNTKKGDRYVCSVCGLAIKIDETCGCMDTCDIVCCGKPMEKKVKK